MKRILISLFVIFAFVTQTFAERWAVEYSSNQLVLVDEDLHLLFMLNTDSKTASIGNGLDSEHNAMYSSINTNPDAPFVNYWDNVTVPEYVTWDNVDYTVTSVAPRAFARTTYVHSITLPKSIRVIGSDAFYMCTYLKNVVMADGVVEINNGAFESCIRLTSINLSPNLTSIGGRAFMNCQALESLSIPGKCTEICEDAFSWCIGLKQLRFEDGEEPLSLSGAYEFGQGWQQYDEVYHYIQRTWRGMFNDCPLNDIYIGRTIQVPELLYADYSPFERIYQTMDNNNKVRNQREGKSLDNLVFGGNVKRITKNLFKKSHIYNLVLPPYLEVIEENAFYEAFEGKNLTIPASCTRIEAGAFQAWNTGGTIRTIECLSPTPPSTVAEAFTKCTGFAVTVPGGAREAYMNDAFWGKYFIIDANDKLVDISVKYSGQLYGRLAYEDMAPTDVYRLKVSGKLNDDDWTVINSMNNLYDLDLSEVEAEDLSAISSITKKLRSLKFPKGLKEIASGLFNNGQLMGKIIIPETCTKIGRIAFNKCGINELVVDGPTVIDDGAFSFCANLSKISLKGGAVAKPNSFYAVKDAYVDNTGLKYVVLGNDVTVEEEAFYSSDNIQEVIIEGDVKSIKKNAFDFYYQRPLPVLRINGSIGEWYRESFVYKNTSNYAPKINELFIDNIDSWAGMSFSSSDANPISFSEKVYINGGEDPVDVTLAESITEIGDYSFYGCPLIRSITLPNSVTRIGNGAFEGCSQLTAINIPNGITTINPKTFNGCVALQDITLPKELTTIDAYAFAGCSSISNLILPKAIKYIGGHAFENCTGITNVDFPLSLENIGENSFAGCTELKKLEAVWIDPIQVNPTAFTNISKKGILWVPVGSVQNYYDKGWGRIPLIDEGLCIIKLHISPGAQLFINDQNYTSDDIAKVWIGEDVEFRFLVQDNCYISNIQINETDVTKDLQDDKLVVKNIEENKEIHAAIRKYVLGDVNDDDFIDIGDITATVRFIQQNPIANSIAKAADVNHDGDIDVGDITGIVNLIHKTADGSRLRTLSMAQTDCILNAVLDNNEQNNGLNLSVDLSNSTDISGLQFELTLPIGYTIPQDADGTYIVSYNNNRIGNLSIKSLTRLPNGNYQFICASTNKTGIMLKEGQILSLPLNVNNSTVPLYSSATLSNIRISDVHANVLHHSDISVSIDKTVTRIDSLNTESICNEGKYIKNGGIYILRHGKIYSTNGINIQ